jgi:hypothetical protein
VFVKEGTLQAVQRGKKPVAVEVLLFNDLVMGGVVDKRAPFVPLFSYTRNKDASWTAQVVAPDSVDYYRLYSSKAQQRQKRDSVTGMKHKTWTGGPLLKALQEFQKVSRKSIPPRDTTAMNQGYLLVLINSEGNLPINVKKGEEEYVLVAGELWQPRFCVLTHDGLDVYVSHEDAAPQLRIDQQKGASLTPENEFTSQLQLPFCFTMAVQGDAVQGQVVSGESTYVFSAGVNGSNVRAGWLSALTMMDPENIRVEANPDAAKQNEEAAPENKYCLKVSHTNATTGKSDSTFLEAPTEAVLQGWLGSLV